MVCQKAWRHVSNRKKSPSDGIYNNLCRELRLRKAYIEHLESLADMRDAEKEILQEKLLDQVTGAIYFLASR